MKYIKLFEELTANGPVDVKIGDVINVADGGEIIPDCEVLNVIKPGEITISSKGHNLLAKYDDGIDGYMIAEQTNPKTQSMPAMPDMGGICPNCGHKHELDMSRFIDKDSIEGTCVGCGEKKFKYKSNIQKWRWT